MLFVQVKKQTRLSNVFFTAVGHHAEVCPLALKEHMSVLSVPGGVMQVSRIRTEGESAAILRAEEGEVMMPLQVAY